MADAAEEMKLFIVQIVIKKIMHKLEIGVNITLILENISLEEFTKNIKKYLPYS